MRHYEFSDIEAVCDCERYISEYKHEPVVGHRCRALWRGGSNETSVHLDGIEWFDFGEKRGGKFMQLVALCEFGSDDNAAQQRAQEIVGDWLGITPKRTDKPRPPEHRRRKDLEAQGYRLVKQYDYTDLDGNVRHFTQRFEKDGEPKQFVQGTPDADSLKGVETVLYNLRAVHDADVVYIAEGEKDAETLIAWGLCGTTAPMGAGKWAAQYTAALRGKHVVISRDRDDAGMIHAKTVARALLGVAASVRIVCPGTTTKDVTDWRDREAGTKEAFLALVDNADHVTKECLEAGEEAEAVARAKAANERPFSNTRSEKSVVDGLKKTVKSPVVLGELIKDMNERFLGFPYRLGDSTIFDHDRDSGEINMFTDADELFAWVELKSGKSVYWDSRTPGAVSRKTFYAGVRQTAKRYESISRVPNWPTRRDVYYAFREKLSPTKGHSALAEFASFFSPADDATRILLRTFFAAPLYFKSDVQRPCWVIDSEDGPGAGKTTIAETLAKLYRCEPIRTFKSQIHQDFDELLKKALSAGGRSSRIMLVDNVTGVFDEPTFADLVTCHSLSGRPPYGRGEETRPNDLTCIITANNAQLSKEMADRSYMLMMRHAPKSVRSWEAEVYSFIETHRFEILGDIIDILDHGKPFQGVNASTRCRTFEYEVFMPMCMTREDYDTALRGILSARDTADVDKEAARQIEDLVQFKLSDIIGERSTMSGETADSIVAYIRSDVLNEWLRERRVTTEKVRDYANAGNTIRFRECQRFRRYPLTASGKDGIERRSGVMWFGRDVTRLNYSGTVYVVGHTGEKSVGFLEHGVCDSSISAFIHDGDESNPYETRAASAPESVSNTAAQTVEQPQDEFADLPPF